MPRPNDAEMRPDSPGERIFLEDLQVGDVIDVWSRRSGGFFLQEDVEVTRISEDGRAWTDRGMVAVRNAGWGEMRLKSRPS